MILFCLVSLCWIRGIKHAGHMWSTSSSRVKHFFKAAHSDESPLLAAKEATYAYHAGIYGMSFKPSDCNLQASLKNF